MSLNIVQGVAMPAKASALVKQGRKGGLKASPKAVVCRASAQPIGERESKAMLASATLAGAMLVMQVPACHAFAYPELFNGLTDIVEEVEEAPVVAPKALSTGLQPPPVPPSAPPPKAGDSEGTSAVAGAAVVAALAALAAYSQSSKGGEAAVKEAPAEPEAYDPEAAAARASEASTWIAKWRTEQDIKTRVAEASAWIAKWRAVAAQREREARVAERAQWIANWRAAQGGKKAGSGSSGEAPQSWMKQMVKNVKSAFAS
uniref:Uncharacterized protein n=1 Tax=Pyramimonas obovata TaxID=1411642 RepID=A0A7S0MYK9_9CHLO